MIKNPDLDKIEKIKNHLRSLLTSARYKHSLGVAKVAVGLAERYGVSKEKALLAALLHDAGKGYSKKGMIKYMLKYRLKIDNPHGFTPGTLIAGGKRGPISRDLSSYRW